MPSGANSKAKCEMSMVRSDAGRPLSRPRLAPSASLHGEIIYMYGVAAEVVSKEAVSDLRDRSGAGVERRPCRFCCVRHACDRIYVGAGGGLRVGVEAVTVCASCNWALARVPHCPPRRSRLGLSSPHRLPCGHTTSLGLHRCSHIVVPPPLQAGPSLGPRRRGFTSLHFTS